MSEETTPLLDTIGDLRMELAAVRRERDRYRKALEEIRDEEGRVCPEFETCAHVACRSSCAAQQIAAGALDGEEAA